MSKGKVTAFNATDVPTTDPGRPDVEAAAVLNGKVHSIEFMESKTLFYYDVTVDDTLKDEVRLTKA